MNLVDDSNCENSLIDNTNDESTDVYEDVNLGGPIHCPPKSKIKGRLRSKRTKGEK